MSILDGKVHFLDAAESSVPFLSQSVSFFFLNGEIKTINIESYQWALFL